MHWVYDDVVVVFFFSIFYKVACIPYNFCCFRCVNVDEHFVIKKVIDDVIVIKYYAHKNLC